MVHCDPAGGVGIPEFAVLLTLVGFEPAAADAWFDGCAEADAPISAGSDRDEVVEVAAPPPQPATAAIKKTAKGASFMLIASLVISLHDLKQLPATGGRQIRQSPECRRIETLTILR